MEKESCSDRAHFNGKNFPKDLLQSAFADLLQESEDDNERQFSTFVFRFTALKGRQNS